MKNLSQHAEKCIRELQRLNIPIRRVSKWMVSKRMTTCYGMCKLNKDGEFTITVSDKLLQDNIDDFPLENTIVHELLHTINMKDGHGEEWSTWASWVNHKLKYKVYEYANYSKYGVHLNNREYKYQVYCPCCNTAQKYKTKGKVIKNIENYICSDCGSHLLVKEI